MCGSGLVKVGCTLSENGIGNGSNVQVLRRLRGGAGSYLDVPGQWECIVCNVCHDAVPNNPPPWVRWGGGGRVVLVLQLGALGLDTFHRGTTGMGMSALQVLVLAPVPPRQRLEKREKLVNCCRL